MIDKIRATLGENENLSSSVKDDILKLVSIFHDNFPDVDLTNLNERLRTLLIKRESMYLVKRPCQYNPYTNEILVNLGRFANSDAEHWLMHCIVGMVTAKDNYYGFDNSENTLLALNEGYTEIITNNLVGDVENNYFTDEVIITNLIGDIIGNDVLYEAYFANDSEKVVKAMIEAEDK